MRESRSGIAASDYFLEGAASLISAAGLAALFGLGSQWALSAISGTQGLQDLARMLVGGFLGMVVGAPLGPWAVARFNSRPFSLLRGWAGSVVGAVIAVAVIAATSSIGGASLSGWIALALIVIGAVTLGNLGRRAS